MRKYILVAGLVLSGCVTMTPQQRAAMQASAARPITCFGPEDCQIRWGRALQWVKLHSAYRFDQASDSLISTKGPLPSSPDSAFTITKLARGGGRYDIDFSAGCDNFIGCIPSVIEEKASFADYVMAP